MAKKPKAKKTKKVGVFILAISSDFGINMSSHKTRNGANKLLLEYCKDQWNAELGPEEMPKSSNELIDRYFNEAPSLEYFTIEWFSLAK